MRCSWMGFQSAAFLRPQGGRTVFFSVCDRAPGWIAEGRERTIALARNTFPAAGFAEVEETKVEVLTIPLGMELSEAGASASK